jgi:biotin operon repressor
VAGAKAAVIERLKRGPASLDDLAPLCQSRHAATMMIYRLRDAGYDIASKPSKLTGYTYTLKRLPGSLKPYRFPPLRDRPKPTTLS